MGRGETVLPGGHAVVPVNARGLSSGQLPCTVRLHDWAGPPVTWSGIVKPPNRTASRTFHPAKGVYVSLPENTVPPWAVALMVLGGLILVSLLAVLVWRRRRLSATADVARHRT